MGQDHLLDLLQLWKTHCRTLHAGEARKVPIPQDLLDQIQACDEEDLQQLEWLARHLPEHANGPTKTIHMANK